jgi:PAS domain S-box-containing protein
MISNKASILIVENEGIIALDIKGALLALDFNVADIAHSGAEAVQKAAGLKPDLILMDIMLGEGINGIEAAEQIRKTADIPIIYLTAFTDSATLQRAKMTGPYGFLIKPFDTRMLYAAIEIALYKHEEGAAHIKQEDRFRNLVENSPMAIIIHNNREILYVNQAAVELLKAQNKEQITGIPVYEIIHPVFQKAEAERLSGLKPDNINKSLEEKLIRLDGEIADVEIYASLVNFEGEPAVQYTVRDISASKRKEKILEATLKILNSINITHSLEELYPYLFKTMQEFVPVRNFLIAFFDKISGEVTYPFTSEDIITKPRERDFDNIIIHDIAEKNKSVLLFENDLARLNFGAVKYSSHLSNWLGIPVNVNEKLAMVFVIKSYGNGPRPGEKEKELLELIAYPVATAVERKLIEEEKRHTTEYLRELNESKDKFFTIISHDLKSPFNSLLGFTDILVNDYDNLSDKERKDYLNTLYMSTKGVYTLLINLLEFSKFRTGRFVFNPQRVALKALLEKQLKTITGTAAKKKIKVDLVMKRDLEVWVDEDMIKSALSNLLSNALKFTGRDGCITVSVIQSNGFAEVSITDTGVGMDKNDIAELFRLDFRRTTPGTEYEDGTGLGLLITKEFVEKNGGRITVNSEKNVGSKFTFTIPVFKQE